MGHPLDGARLKIVRAQEHVCTLKSELSTYLAKHPYDIRIENIEIEPHKNFPSVTSVEAPKITIKEPPPLHLSLIVGDCITNLRASLDYVMWELALRYFSPRLDVGKASDRRLTYFPISSNLFIVNHLDTLTQRGIPAAAIDQIKSVQPNNRGYEPLELIDRIANIDKHRMPVLLLSYVPGVIWAKDWRGNLLGIRSGELHAERADDGRIVMKMDNQYPFAVTLNNRGVPKQPIDRTLEQIVKTAAHVIPCFERFF